MAYIASSHPSLDILSMWTRYSNIQLQYSYIYFQIGLLLQQSHFDGGFVTIIIIIKELNEILEISHWSLCYISAVTPSEMA